MKPPETEARTPGHKKPAPPSGAGRRFPLTHEQCEVLLAFESFGSVYELADHFHKDVSVISRQLKKIAQTAPVLEKQQGRWKLTPMGKQVAIWTRDSMGRLSHILEARSALRIGATREFASRILCPQLRGFLGKDLAKVDLTILTAESGIEEMLLAGEIDFGFDCGRPFDPSIRYKQIRKERFGIFASPAFARTHGLETLPRVLQAPNLQYRRVSTARYLQLPSEVRNVAGNFNDLSAMREACIAGAGWAVLPLYSVGRELDDGRLTQLPGKPVLNEHFGVWWLRGSSQFEPFIRRAQDWLRTQEM